MASVLPPSLSCSFRRRDGNSSQQSESLDDSLSLSGSFHPAYTLESPFLKFFTVSFFECPSVSCQDTN